LIANKVIEGVDPVAFTARLEEAFGLEVAACIPLSPAIARLGSDGIFARLQPDHPVVAILQQLARKLLGMPGHDRDAEVAAAPETS
jgi:hypothetical protein